MVVANGFRGDAAFSDRAGIVSSLDALSQDESTLVSHVGLGARERTVASASASVGFFAKNQTSRWQPG